MSGAADSSGAASARSTSASSEGPGRQGGERATVLIIGTSLTAGLGLDPEQAYPAVIQRMADSAGFAVHVVNAGLSGETSAGALRRLEWIMRDRADLVVVETGANDGLRGLDPDSTRANLTAIVRGIKNAQPGARVVLVQMEAPPNLGGDYTRRFHDMYGDVAKSEGVGLTPFLLDNVAGVPRLNQADGIHPTAEGARIVARNIWPSLEPEFRALGRTATAGH
jgi:acyl-CoA thioesterase I